MLLLLWSGVASAALATNPATIVSTTASVVTMVSLDDSET